ISAVAGFVIGWLYNFVIMSVVYNGWGKVPIGGPSVGGQNTQIGSLISFSGSAIIFALYGFRKSMGKERFNAAVRNFPAHLKAFWEEDREAAAAHFLWGMGGALLVTALVGPWLSGVLAIGFLVGFVGYLRPLLRGVLMIAYRVTVTKIRPDRHRPLKQGTMAVGGMGAVAAMAVGVIVNNQNQGYGYGYGTGVPQASTYVVLAVIAGVLAYMLGRRQITVSTAATMLVAGVAAMFALHELVAHASDGGFSECGGNYFNCPGMDGDFSNATNGGIAGGLGGAVGMGLGQAPNSWPPPDKLSDCPACDKAATTYHGAVKAWLDAHPGSTWNDFMAWKISGSQAEAYALSAKLDKLQSDVQGLEKQADHMIQVMDDANKPTIPLDQMTEQQRNDMMKQAVKDFHAKYPGMQGVDQFNQAFSYVNRNTNVDAGQLAAGILVDLFTQAPGVVSGMASDAADAAKVLFSPEMAAALGQDLSQGDWMKRIAAPFQNVDWSQMGSDLMSPSQVGSDMLASAGAVGTGGMNLIDQTMKALDHAATTGDTTGVAKAIDTIAANLLLQEALGVGFAKVGGMANAQFLEMTGQAVTDTSEARTALETGQAVDATAPAHTGPALDPLGNVIRSRSEIDAALQTALDNAAPGTQVSIPITPAEAEAYNVSKDVAANLKYQNLQYDTYQALKIGDQYSTDARIAGDIYKPNDIGAKSLTPDELARYQFDNTKAGDIVQYDVPIKPELQAQLPPANDPGYIQAKMDAQIQSLNPADPSYDKAVFRIKANATLETEAQHLMTDGGTMVNSDGQLVPFKLAREPITGIDPATGQSVMGWKYVDAATGQPFRADMDTVTWGQNPAIAPGDPRYLPPDVQQRLIYTNSAGVIAGEGNTFQWQVLPENYPGGATDPHYLQDLLKKNSTIAGINRDGYVLANKNGLSLVKTKQ
ncbi:MAG TPA: hypothetical protein VG015_07700, partial [Candidatus Dormibacteraeota bacterium]|nr:hypothetical protein [Candidatus Dormibacteraeota bacterium]